MIRINFSLQTVTETSLEPTIVMKTEQVSSKLNTRFLKEFLETNLALFGIFWFHRDFSCYRSIQQL